MFFLSFNAIVNFIFFCFVKNHLLSF